MQTGISITASVALLALSTFATPGFADDMPRCTGDQSVCAILQIDQRGTDNGAHVAIRVTSKIPFIKNLRLGISQTTINMRLSLAGRQSDCGGNGLMRTANLRNVSSGGLLIVPGYLCELSAAWGAN